MSLNNAARIDNDLQRFHEPWVLIVRGLLGLITASIGVIVNFVTIAALWRTKQWRNAFIINYVLSISDLLYCAFVLPIMYSRYLGSNWVHVPWICSTVVFFCYGNVGTSLMSVVFITIDRYVNIVHYNKYATIYTSRNIAFMILFNWIFSHIFLLPALFGIWGKYAYDADILTCDMVKDDTGNSSFMTVSIVGFVLPCLTISFCYARIVIHLLLSEKQLAKHSNKNIDTKTIWATLKRTKMVFIIFVTFIACVLPILVIKNIDGEAKYPGLHMLGYILYNLNSCVNPFIYVITTKRHRDAYVSLWKYVMCKNHDQQNSSNVYYDRNLNQNQDI